MDEVTLGQVVFEICHFLRANIFTVTTHTHLHLNTAVSRKYAEAEKASKCNLFLRGETLDRTALSLLIISFQRMKR